MNHAPPGDPTQPSDRPRVVAGMHIEGGGGAHPSPSDPSNLGTVNACILLCIPYRHQSGLPLSRVPAYLAEDALAPMQYMISDIWAASPFQPKLRYMREIRHIQYAVHISRLQITERDTKQ